LFFSFNTTSWNESGLPTQQNLFRSSYWRRSCGEICQNC